MTEIPYLIKSPKSAGVRSVIDVSTFGFTKYTTAAMPDRVYIAADAATRPTSILQGEAAIDIEAVRTPLEFLAGRGGPSANSAEDARRALARLEALWLLVEDRHRLLDADSVEPLAHQATLVEHVLSTPNLVRVLIADEVGLGKTIEAALILRRLIRERAGPAPRVLYLTEAQLVENVVEEFERLELRPRRYTAERDEARLGPNDCDPLVVASIHRAVYHQDDFAVSGPWDVIVVDEAHHLSDWSPRGHDPQERMRLVRTLIEQRLVPNGRVILLSGTPHQGHTDRFKNLLRLLCEDGTSLERARGRVIYRIKDDITDWDRRPLFPDRDVRKPTRVDVGADYHSWLSSIHALLDPGMSRSAAWRRAQALQWAASSPQAGLAYLVRLTLREGFDATSVPTLRAAIAALRPYRGRPADENPVELEGALRQQVGDDDTTSDLAVSAAALGKVLRQGISLIEADALAHKLKPVFQWFDEAPTEKFVLFAQPIETVYELKRRLEARFGRDTVSLIVGGQDREVRREQIRRFQEEPNVRALVSSRSGGEGINLQISRRLIHFDVPWNPMDLEQRVGRVHRFGSTDTIIVETLVLAGSREERVLDRARARLGQIVRDLEGAQSDRFELLYSRTMSQIPVEELARLMAGENFGPLSSADADRLDELITAGFNSFRDTDDDFRQHSVRLRSLERGETRDEDVVYFLTQYAQATRETGWKRRVFKPRPPPSGPLSLDEEDAVVLRLGAQVGYVGRDSGIGLTTPSGQTTRPPRIGLNTPSVARAIRAQVEGADGNVIRGAGAFALSDSVWREVCEGSGLPSWARDGALLWVAVTRRLDLGSPSTPEVGAILHAHLIAERATTSTELNASQLASIIRALRGARLSRRKVESHADAAIAQEREQLEKLRTTKPNEPRNAVFPIAALWIDPRE